MADRTGELLLKALRQLDQAEQDEVVAALLTGSVRAPVAQAPFGPPAGLGPMLSASQFPLAAGPARPEVVELLTRAERTGGEGTDLRVLPVRLPSADYDRLREWSRAHEFSMAVIIRTLVERFLDDQQRRESHPTASTAAATSAPADLPGAPPAD